MRMVSIETTLRFMVKFLSWADVQLLLGNRILLVKDVPVHKAREDITDLMHKAKNYLEYASHGDENRAAVSTEWAYSYNEIEYLLGLLESGMVAVKEFIQANRWLDAHARMQLRYSSGEMRAAADFLESWQMCLMN